MAEQWPIKVKAKRRPSVDIESTAAAAAETLEYTAPTEDNVYVPMPVDPHDSVEDGDNEPQVPVLEDDLSEALLAASLGVEVVAPVVPIPDSQIPPDSLDIPQPEGPVTAASSAETPQDQELFWQDAQSDHPPGYVDSQDLGSVAPTEIEKSPSPSKTSVVHIQDSPLVTVKDPMPSAGSYSKEDIAMLQSRIADLKQLTLDEYGSFMLFFPLWLTVLSTCLGLGSKKDT